MFWFDVLFTSEKRYYITINERGENEYKQFDKHLLLCKDADDNWYYNTDFIFEASVGNTLAYDKMSQYQRIQQDFQMGALDKQQYWQLLSHLNFPLASKILEQEKSLRGEENKAMALLNILKQMPPQQLMQFLSLPPGEQMQMIQELGNIEQQPQGKPMGQSPMGIRQPMQKQSPMPQGQPMMGQQY